MCFLKYVLSYLCLKRKWKNYLKIKERSKRGSRQSGRRRTCNPIIEFYSQQKKKSGKLIKNISTVGTFENFVTMAVVGLVVGILITFCHLYLVLDRREASFLWSVLLRMPMSVVITCLLAFSWRSRCFLLLAPLQMFSNSGSYFMTGQLMVLAVTGPAATIRHNLNVLQESCSCQQRGVMAAAAEIADILFGPFSSFKQAAAMIAKGIRTMVDKIQRILVAFKRVVMTVAGAIQNAARWINNKITRCKTNVGTTYDRCKDAFSWVTDECKAQLPAVLAGVSCSVTDLASNLCSTIKPGEYLCDLVSFTVDPLVTTVHQLIRRLWDRAYTLFYFDVDIHHEYSVDDNSKYIADELEQKLLGLFDTKIYASIAEFIYNALSMFLEFYFVWSMFRYYRLYQRREDFDNYFINDRLLDIDVRETLKGEEAIFPLRRVERRKYIRATSYTLTRQELTTYAFSLISIIKGILYLLLIGLDYVLYYIIDKARLFMTAALETYPSRTEISVEGSGFIAELSRRVVRALSYINNDFLQTQMLTCVPNPKEPNRFINRQIYFWLFIYWFTWLTKPYMLRTRHVLMDWYFPDKAEQRAIYLYKKISIQRNEFISLVRITLRSTLGRGGGKSTVSVLDMLRVRWPWMTRFLGKGGLADQCSVCGHLKPPLYHCPTGDCRAMYCDDCYINVHGVCCLCRQPMNIQDFRNISLEPATVSVDSDDVDEIEEYSDLDGEELTKSDFLYQGGKARTWIPDSKRLKSFRKQARRKKKQQIS